MSVDEEEYIQIQLEEHKDIINEFHQQIEHIENEENVDLNVGDGIIDLHETNKTIENDHTNQTNNKELEQIALIEHQETNNAICLTILGFLCCCIWWAVYFNFSHSKSITARKLANFSLICASIVTILLMICFGFGLLFVAFYIWYLIHLLSKVSDE